MKIELDRRVRAVLIAAAKYRKAELDGSPRLWRGKDLQDLANKLDDALEELPKDLV